MRKFYLLTLITLWAVVGQAQTLKIKVNGGSEQQGSSLENALSNAGYSSTNYSSITSLEVTAGTWTTADWELMVNGANPKLSNLRNFTITKNISNVANIPEEISSGYSQAKNVFRQQNLSNVFIAKLKYLPNSTFRQCTALTQAEFPNVDSIAASAFMQNTSLIKIIIPQIKIIGNNAFNGCKSLTRMEVGSNPPKRGNEYTFNGLPENRHLSFVDANGTPLTGETLKTAQRNYSKPANGGTESNGLVKWHGWLFYPSYTVIYATDGPGSIVDAWGDPVTKYLVSEGHDAPTVTAQPNPGYVLNRWSDGTSVVDKQHMAKNVQADITITAYFTLPSVKKKLTYAAGPNGRVNGDSKVEVEVSPGEDGPVVEAQPNNGYKFLNWSDFNISNPRQDINIQNDTTITANFVLSTDATYDLTYNAGLNGSIVGEARQRVLAHGNGQQVTAKANSTHIFVRWDDGNPNDTRRDLGVTHNINVTAEFVSSGTPIHNLNYSISGNGSISGYTTQNVAHGTHGVEVEVIPISGHKFVRWSDGRIDNPRQDKNVQGNISVTAIVVSLTTAVHTLKYVVHEANTGTIIGQSTQLVEHGGNGVMVTAEAATNYTFLRWNDGVAIKSRQDLNVQKDSTIKAIFVNSSTIIYDLKYSVKNASSGSINGFATQRIEKGGDGAPVEAKPANNYKFVRWDDGKLDASRIEKNVQSNLNFMAILVPINTPIYKLNYSVTGNGRINGHAYQEVEEGGDGIEISAIAETGHKFVRWNDGSINNPRQDKNVHNNIDVKAIVVPNETDVFTLTYNTEANGTINGTTPQHVEAGGDGVEVEAIAKTNYIFLHWSDSLGTAKRQELNVQHDTTVTAKYVTASTTVYTLTYSATPGGRISGIANQRVIAGGNGAKVTAIAEAGYKFVRWSDGKINTSRWDSNVQNNIDVTAEFVTDATPIYTLIYNASEGGRIVGLTEQRVAEGGNALPVRAEAETDYRFNGWDDGYTTANRTDMNVRSNITTTAEFVGTYCDIYRKDSIVNACYEFWWGDTIHYTTSGHKVIVTEKEHEFNTTHNKWCPFSIDLHLTLETPPDTAYFTVTTSNSYTFEGITYDSIGTYTVVRRFERPGFQCDSVVRIYLTILKQSPTHIDATTNTDNQIALYPNPTRTGFYVETEATEVQISSISGQLYLQLPVNGKTYVDISHLPSGIYIVRAGNAAAKMVKI